MASTLSQLHRISERRKRRARLSRRLPAFHGGMGNIYSDGSMGQADDSGDDAGGYYDDNGNWVNTDATNYAPGGGGGDVPPPNATLNEGQLSVLTQATTDDGTTPAPSSGGGGGGGGGYSPPSSSPSGGGLSTLLPSSFPTTIAGIPSTTVLLALVVLVGTYLVMKKRS